MAGTASGRSATQSNPREVGHRNLSQFGIWEDNDVAKLRSLAGKLPVRDLAAELGLLPGATGIGA